MKVWTWIASSLIVLCAAGQAPAWSNGHFWINGWAVDHLPNWQRAYFGPENLKKLASEYAHIQDQYAGTKDPKWEAYCNPPGVGRRLHDISPPEKTVEAVEWFLNHICRNMRAGDKDEAMKYLGVLCHWNEDPSSPGAHSMSLTSQKFSLSESVMQYLIRSPQDMLGYTYEFGYRGLPIKSGLQASRAKFLKEEAYTPQLLGGTISEAAARICQRQRLIAHRSMGVFVPLIVAENHKDKKAVESLIRDVATDDAKYITDLIYTVGCLAADRIDPKEAAELARQPLSQWLPDNFVDPKMTLYPKPYYSRPYLVNFTYDARRNVHPLAFGESADTSDVVFGFGMTAPYEMHYTLVPAGVFGKFETRVGLDAVAGEKGAVIFSILVNGKEAAKTQPLKVTDAPVTLSVDLPPTGKTLKLTLKTEPARNTNPLDNLAVWAEPTLVRAVHPTTAP